MALYFARVLYQLNQRLKAELERLRDVRSARNKRAALRKAAMAHQADRGTMRELIDAVNRTKLGMQELKQLRIQIDEQPLEEKEQTLQFLHRCQEKQQALRGVLMEALGKLNELDQQRATMTKAIETRDYLQL